MRTTVIEEHIPFRYRKIREAFIELDMPPIEVSINVLYHIEHDDKYNKNYGYISFVSDHLTEYLEEVTGLGLGIIESVNDDEMLQELKTKMIRKIIEFIADVKNGDYLMCGLLHTSNFIFYSLDGSKIEIE